MSKRYSIYIRNVVFGMVDSLVSTVGLLSGMAFGEVPKKIIILTWLIYATVEAFSMGVGSFLSEESAEEFEKKKIVKDKIPTLGAIAMFFSSITTAAIPFAPYLFTAPHQAFYYSIAISIVSLAIVGFISGRLSKVGGIKQSLRMALLGGGAIILGVVVGEYFKFL
jgi:VIT1/CCC1 family predicted Fe2+/Mn2+ transporter